jgi:hypothetical protein
MGRCILKQKDGKYCVFSSIVDDIICYDSTKEELLNWWLEEERKKVTKKFDEWFKEADEMDDEDKMDTIQAIQFNKSNEGIKRLLEAKELLGLK